FQFQWWKDNLPLPGETNDTLTVLNVQSNKTGQYSVVIGNSFGTTASSNAVLALDQAPAPQPDTISRFASSGARVSTAQLLANDADPDGDMLSIVGISTNSVAGGAVSLAGGWVYYTPPSGYQGADTFSYFVSDGPCGLTATATVTVAVKPDNTVPS